LVSLICEEERRTKGKPRHEVPEEGLGPALSTATFWGERTNPSFALRARFPFRSSCLVAYKGNHIFGQEMWLALTRLIRR
jgi:hypothetical protein